jgi:putative ABC transport system permease protein
MRALDIKLYRDFRRLWAQALAVSLVLACGVATLILAVGSHNSLLSTREAYYQRNGFAHVFASASRAPLGLEPQLAAIEGVLAVEPRIAERVLLQMPGMREPGSGMLLSLPDHQPPRLNVPYLRSGRMPVAGRDREALISEAFAKAHGLSPGDSFSGIANGKQLTFNVTGVALSPEYVYAIGPGDLVPDDRRFGVIWMRRATLEAVFDQEGAFNSVSLLLQQGQPPDPVIAEVDRLLKPYGGTGAYARTEQTSHAFLDSELTQLEAMARVIPPIFLLVSAFLINMILSRLIALEREQIGLLKALGYSSATVAWHYVKLVLVIAAVGILIGFVAGTWLGDGMTRLYAKFFHFPFFIFERSPGIYALAAAASIAAAVAGALKAVNGAASLPPATAMQPAPPTLYRKAGMLSRIGGMLVSRLAVMGLRHLVRWPVRSGLAVLGASLAVALLVTAMFSFGSITYMVDAVFFRTERQDATIAFSTPLAPRVVHDLRHLPGVMAVEPYRAMAVEIRHGNRSERISLIGKPPATELSRVLDLQLDPIELLKAGVVLSERLAWKLGARVGDVLDISLLDEGGRLISVPVTLVNQTYTGLTAYMDIGLLDSFSALGPRRSGAYLRLDRDQLDAIYAEIKQMPAAASLALKETSLRLFRDTIQQNVFIMTTVYVVLSITIAFGVVYNSARIQLSERARELASLRVLGFTEAEVAAVLAVELAAIVALAQPLGWALGAGFSWLVVQGFQSDLFRVPFILERSAFGWSSVVVVVAAIVSGLIVIRRVYQLDLVRVLKTRE